MLINHARACKGNGLALLRISYRNDKYVIIASRDCPYLSLSLRFSIMRFEEDTSKRRSEFQKRWQRNAKCFGYFIQTIKGWIHFPILQLFNRLWRFLGFPCKVCLTPAFFGAECDDSLANEGIQFVLRHETKFPLWPREYYHTVV